MKIIASILIAVLLSLAIGLGLGLFVGLTATIFFNLGREASHQVLRYISIISSIIFFVFCIKDIYIKEKNNV